MYSTISVNTHHFRGEYTAVDDQWDAMQGAILKALVPENIGERGEVDWRREMERFLWFWYVLVPSRIVHVSYSRILCHDILARPPYLIWLAKIPYLIRPR